MGFLDFFRREKQVTTAILSLFQNQASPGLKDSEYVRAYLGWVYACTNAIAEDVARMNIRLMQKKGKKAVEVENHEALSLLYKPNGNQTFTDLITETQSYLELVGETFWYLVKNMSGSKRVEIVILESNRVTVAINKKGVVDGYVYTNKDNEKIPLEIDEIIHFKRFNPKNKYRGMGTVEAAALAIDTDTNAANWNNNFFYNAASPAGLLKTTGTLSSDQRERIKKQFQEKYGGVQNAHKLLVLEGGLDYTRIALTQKEMDFLEQRRYSRDEILGIFRVPKGVLGIVEDVNRANAEATDYIFGKRVVDPKANWIIERINQFYLPLMGLEPAQYYFTYDSLVPQNEELIIKKNQAGIASGYYTINEVRASEGKPPVDGGDEVYIPFNMMPLGSEKTQPTDQPKEIAEDKDTVIKSFGDLLRGKKSDQILKESIVAKRNKFTKSEILKRKAEYQKILLEVKAYTVRKLKLKKSLEKDAKQDVLESVFADIDGEFIKVLDSANTDVLSASMLFAGQEAIRQVGVNMTFDMKHPRAIDWLKTNALKHATQVLNTLKDEMRDRIIAGIDAGKGAQEIAADITEFYDTQSGWRALRIARSEVITAYAQGSLEGYRQSEVVKMKKWSTSGRDPCPECLDNEAQGQIGLTASFHSGDDAPAAHPNCECVIIPVLGE